MKIDRKLIIEMYKDVEDPIERTRLIKNEHNRQWKKANKDKVRAAKKRYCEKYPEKIKEQNKRFRDNNPEYKKIYRDTHKEEAKEWWKNRSEEQKKNKALYNRQWKNQRYNEDINYRLRGIISTAIHRSLKEDGTKTDKLKNILGYTIEELKVHLESQFEDWMTWDNLGLTATEPRQTWQIDHIIPVNTFNIVDTECEEFKKCWALSNLRPLDSYSNNRRPIDGSDIEKE